MPPRRLTDDELVLHLTDLEEQGLPRYITDVETLDKVITIAGLDRSPSALPTAAPTTVDERPAFALDGSAVGSGAGRAVFGEVHDAPTRSKPSNGRRTRRDAGGSYPGAA